jgi:putative transposase
MSHRILSGEQLRLLSANPHVSKATQKSILYSGDFKLRAIKEQQAGSSPGEIFSIAGFPEEIVSPRKASELLAQWKRLRDTRGESALREAVRGAKKKLHGKPTDRTSLEYVEWLEMRLDFQRELRALKSGQTRAKKKGSR